MKMALSQAVESELAGQVTLGPQSSPCKLGGHTAQIVWNRKGTQALSKQIHQIPALGMNKNASSSGTGALGSPAGTPYFQPETGHAAQLAASPCLTHEKVSMAAAL